MRVEVEDSEAAPVVGHEQESIGEVDLETPGHHGSRSKLARAIAQRFVHPTGRERSSAAYEGARVSRGQDPAEGTLEGKRELAKLLPAVDTLPDVALKDFLSLGLARVLETLSRTDGRVVMSCEARKHEVGVGVNDLLPGRADLLERCEGRRREFEHDPERDFWRQLREGVRHRARMLGRVSVEKGVGVEGTVERTVSDFLACSSPDVTSIFASVLYPQISP